MANILRLLAMRILVLGVLFASAGRWDLPFLWGYVALFTVFGLALLSKTAPQSRQPRGSDKDASLRLLLVPFVLGRLSIAGLDVGRFHWSCIPCGVQWAAFLALAACGGIVFWSRLANRFFSPIVSIQVERGHHLITAGPYGYVRHPGYAGMIFSTLCSGPALGSWWALLPIAGCISLIVRRTVLEDRLLRRELKGYAEYANQVRYRLVPGVW